MAMYTVFDAPLQMLSDKPSLYERFPECTDFISKVPTVFDDCRTLQGEMGEYIVTAKRKGATWFVGAMTSWKERELELKLDFLDNATYKAVIFRDGVNAKKIASDYKRVVETLPSDRKVSLSMAPGGGWVARIY